VVDVRSYLLVLDTALLWLDDKRGHEPINYLVQQQEQEQSEVVVLSLTEQTKLSSLELVLGAASGSFPPAKFPITPPPDHDRSAAAEHRMNLTVQHRKTIGCQASGLVSGEDLVKAADAETRAMSITESS
jgi:hypothetical protein